MHTKHLRCKKSLPGTAESTLGLRPYNTIGFDSQGPSLIINPSPGEPQKGLRLRLIRR